jgi:hypothetical protein
LISRQIVTLSKVATTRVNRAHKSDRLPILSADPVTNTTIIPKNSGSPGLTVRGDGGPASHKIIDVDDGKPVSKPAPMANCEGAASPIADPTLSRFVGRCFV